MADIKGAINKYNEISAKSGDNAKALEKRSIELQSKIKDIINSVSFAGLTNVTAKTRYSDSIVFEVAGIKDVNLRIFKHWSSSVYKAKQSDVNEQFGIVFERQSFGSYNEPTSIFRSDVNSKVDEDASKLGTTVDKMLDENIKMCQLLKTFRADVFNPKGKIYAKLKEWADVELEIYNEPVEDIKAVQAAKQEIALAEAAVFEEFRNSVTEALSKGISVSAKAKTVLYANIEKHKSFLNNSNLTGLNLSKYVYNEDSFIRECIGYSYPAAIKSEAMFPLFWNKSDNKPVEVANIKLVKQNAKSVSLVVDEVSKSELSTLSKSNNDYRLFVTEYSSRNGTVYIKSEPSGTKGLKTATSFERLFVIALAYKPELITKEIIDFVNLKK